MLFRLSKSQRVKSTLLKTGILIIAHPKSVLLIFFALLVIASHLVDVGSRKSLLRASENFTLDFLISAHCLCTLTVIQVPEF